MYEYNFHRVWIERYGKEIGEKLIKLLHKEMDKRDLMGVEVYDCTDNFRCCEIGNNQEETQYEKQLEEGCCGFKDWEVKVSGKKYKLGFNYGH